jgi:hypothetical protein
VVGRTSTAERDPRNARSHGLVLDFPGDYLRVIRGRFPQQMILSARPPADVAAQGAKLPPIR